jgi:hypothetical protein
MDEVKVKGAFLRGYALALKRLGMWSLVFDRGSPQLRDALQSPPPTSTWIDYRVCEEILLIVQADRGMSSVRRLGHDAVTAGVAPFMQNFVQGVLRVFGVSPASMFGLMNKVSGQTTRGIEHSYVPTSEHSGVHTVNIPSWREVESVVWYSSAGGLEIVFDVCHVLGTVQDPIVVDNGLGNRAEFRVSWRR